MKIRNSFVSNSSSSSFVVIYKSDNDFIKFDRFKGYQEFINDLNNSNIKDAEVAISEHLKEFYYNTYFKFTHEEYYKNDSRMVFNFDWLDFLFEESKVDDKEWWNIIQETNLKGSEFWMANKENLNANNPEYVKYHDGYWNDKETEAKMKIKDIAKQIVKGLKDNGYNLGWMRYHDDTNEGYYMETGFMPFIKCNPERDYLIITQSEH
jgi:hypothetical protein